MGTSAFVAVTLVVGVLVIGGAVFIGKSDTGEIDVSATIQNSNQAAIENGGDPADQVGTVSDAFRNMPNGGLVPQAAQETPPEPQTTPETEIGADATGTSTDSVDGEAATTETPTEEETAVEPDVATEVQ